MKGNSLFFIVSALLIVGMASFGLAIEANPDYDPTKPCNEQTTFSTLVCGATPNSVQGYGAVDICGKCYPCGADDGVCPEDFYSDGVRTSCKNCPDPDCGKDESNTNTVTVKVKLEDGGTVDSEVVAIYPYGEESLGNTGSDGILENKVVRSGRIRFKAIYSDFDSQIAETYIPRGGHNETTIYLSQGSCHEDCTGAFREICKADCAGVNNCSFSSYEGTQKSYDAGEIATLCDYKPIGDKIKLEQNSTHTVYATCCAGEPVITEERKQIDISSNLKVNTSDSIKHLAHRVLPVKYEGKIYDLVISSWEK
ncbi:MAG: hypothetical protein ACLFTH_03730 [Candidatus Woesearchaeota archaeon]